MIVTGAAKPLSNEPGRSANLAVSRADADEHLRSILRQTLAIPGETVDALTPASGLFGALPEIDSMAVALLFTAIEDRFGFTVEDDEVDSGMLETYGALLAFVERKLIAG